MGLSLREQRILSEIERGLAHEDPALARALGAFTPRRRPSRRLVGWSMLGGSVLLLLGAVLLRSGLLLLPAAVIALATLLPSARHHPDPSGHYAAPHPWP